MNNSTTTLRSLPLLLTLLTLSATANGQLVSALGQQGTTLASRCADPNARFNFSDANGGMYGPSGIAIDPRGRIFVTDYGGHRVLTWPDVGALDSCSPADNTFGAGEMAGPEAVAFDVRSEMVFVADTLNHTVNGYRNVRGRPFDIAGTWTLVVTLGTRGNPGNASHQFYFPRGLALDSKGRLFVADDYNKRILIFDPPFTNGQQAADSIGAGADGGFSEPKGLAITGDTLFVADYDKNRVLRFTGPFTTPHQTYVATGSFTGINQPVDVAVHADGSLLVTSQGNQRVMAYADAAWAPSSNAPDAQFFVGFLNAEPLGVACDIYGRVFVADYRNFRVLISATGRRTPVNPASSAPAQTLLTTLHALPLAAAARVAIGQQLTSYLYGRKSDPDAWYGAWLKLQQRALPLPKVMGAELSDLVTYDGFSPNQDALNELIRHGQAGNIVTLVWHPDNPTLGDFGTSVSTADLQKMVDRNTDAGQRFQAQLDLAADVLQKFHNANVPVLFRPMHEQNGTFFWWGHDGSTGADLRDRQAAWVALWRRMVTELTVRKGLQNLLFTFCVNHISDDSVASPLTYYPGGNWTDVVSIDTYNDQLNLAGEERGTQHYAALISTGKPFGLSEFGQGSGEAGTGPNGADWDARTLRTRILDSYRRTTFAVAWYSAVEGGTPYIYALPDVSFTRELLTDQLFLTQPQ